MGYRKLAARPKHYAQDPQAIEEFKNVSPPQWQKLPPGDCQEFCAVGHDDEKERIIMAIEKELLDQLLAGRDPSEVFGKDGLLDDLKKALSERILNAELDDHLDVERLEGGPANRRNGSPKKTVLTGTSKMTLTIPRDRAGTFDPKLIARCQRRFPDFDDKIISMYARGMTAREIQGHLEELYGINVSPA